MVNPSEYLHRPALVAAFPAADGKDLTVWCEAQSAYLSRRRCGERNGVELLACGDVPQVDNLPGGNSERLTGRGKLDALDPVAVPRKFLRLLAAGDVLEF